MLSRVKLEADARAALDPNTTGRIHPKISEELGNDWPLEIGILHVIERSRTCVKMVLILHGALCGSRDTKRQPTDADRISRHY